MAHMCMYSIHGRWCPSIHDDDDTHTHTHTWSADRGQTRRDRSLDRSIDDFSA